MLIMLFKMLIGAVIGGFLGFLYFKKVGCSTGHCPITSNKYSSIIYGSLLGLVVSNSF